MKRLFTRIISVLVICLMAFNMFAFADEKPITVYLDGTQLEFDVDPVLESGRTLVPMRVIFEALGAKVSWDAETWTAIAVKDDITIKITIDDMKMYKNGEVIELDVPARLIGSRTLVPARAVSEGMGAKVDWNQDEWKVIITTSGESAETSSESKEYGFDELSETDRKKLDEAYDSIRYSYEQYLLPSYIFGDDEIKNSIINQDAYIANIIAYAWWETIASTILNIQMESEDNYTLDAGDLSEEELYSALFRMVDELGYYFDDFFEMGYVISNEGNTIFCIEFYEAVPSMIISCKYIGIALDSQNNVRYFTAETDPVTTDVYFLCEVFDEGGRGTITQIPMDIEAFINGIDEELK